MNFDTTVTHTFSYTYKNDNPPVKIFEGSLSDQNVTITSNDDDMTIWQLFNLFKSYVLAVGYCEKSFYDGCGFYANEFYSENMNGDENEI